MKIIHQSHLNSELLQTFITIFEERSITAAARHMEQSPSTLSHRLERLRKIFDDDLFVRAGRRIIPTSFAEDIISDARIALNAIHAVGEHQRFNPEDLDYEFIIATTDVERLIFVLDAYKEILRVAPNVRFRFVWEDHANVKSLRRRDVDFIISPIPGSDDADIRKRLLMRDRSVCYYDPKVSSPPNTLEKYSTANHVRIMYSESDINMTDAFLKMAGRSRKVTVTMPSVSELPMLIIGTELTTTLPFRLSKTILKDLAYCRLPFKINRMDYSLYWHERHQTSPKHRWVREQLFAYVDQRPELKKTPV